MTNRETSPKLFETMRLAMVPRAGVEPARPYGQRILRMLQTASPSLTKGYEPVFTGLAVVKVSLCLPSYRIDTYRHHLSPILIQECWDDRAPDFIIAGKKETA